jgi:hypothetical protein
MPRFAVAHQVAGSSEPPTYYRIGGGYGHIRVGTSIQATTWSTEQEARDAIHELGLSDDPEVFVADISAQ